MHLNQARESILVWNQRWAMSEVQEKASPEELMSSQIKNRTIKPYKYSGHELDRTFKSVTVKRRYKINIPW